MSRRRADQVRHGHTHTYPKVFLARLVCSNAPVVFLRVVAFGFDHVAAALEARIDCEFFGLTILERIDPVIALRYPLGALIGGILIDRTHDVALVYGVIGGLIVVIGFTFAFTPLGYAERYIPQAEAGQ